MRPLLIACLLSVAPTAWGGSLLIESAPTVNLPGFTTFTFSMQTDPGESFRGVEAVFYAEEMNQVNPFGIATIYNDINGFFPLFGEDVSQDSQFLFSSTDVLSIGAEESNTLLKAAISGIESNGIQEQQIPFAQVVTGCYFEFRLAFDLGGNEPALFEGAYICPEPTTATLATLPLAMLSTRRRLAR